MGLWNDFTWELSMLATKVGERVGSKVNEGFRVVDSAVTSTIDMVGEIEDSVGERVDGLIEAIGEEGMKLIDSAFAAINRTGDGAVERVSDHLDKLEQNPLEAFRLLGCAIAMGGAAVAAPHLIRLLVSRGASIPVGALAGGMVGSKVADYLTGSSLLDPVDEPEVGGVVLCDLLSGVAEHSGIYVGDGKIVHLDGRGSIEEVSRQQFLARLGGTAIAMNIYTSCRGSLPVGSALAASRAQAAVGFSRDYNVFINNCHQFTAGCITGNYENADNFLRFLEHTATKDFGMDGWRIWR